MEECCILHFELLAVALGQNACVREREPAAPATTKFTVPVVAAVSGRRDQGALHLVLFVLSVVPAVTGFRH